MSYAIFWTQPNRVGVLYRVAPTLAQARKLARFVAAGGHKATVRRLTA